jgi:outer membrane lipoprotein
MNIRIHILLLATVSLFLQTGCNSQPVLPLPANNPPVLAVQGNPDAYQGQRVTWGGTIINTEVKQNNTWLIILAKPLDNQAEPKQVDHSTGRFLAVKPGFHDPAVFAADRQITVTGVITGSQTRKIGEHDYRYPVVQVERFHLWPIRVPTHWHDDYWYDPWFDPWYPWYGPYWYPRSYFYLQHRHYLE